MGGTLCRYARDGSNTGLGAEPGIPSKRGIPASPGSPMEAVIFSRSIRKKAHLEALLPEFSKIHNKSISLNRSRIGAVLGWGYKGTSDPARAFAEKQGIQYTALEDGFLRSVRLGVEGEALLSLVVDPVGIYYDCNRPSYLENSARCGRLGKTTAPRAGKPLLAHDARL